MKNLQSIVEFIEINSEDIINNIDIESISVYSFIKERFISSNIIDDYIFQFVYKSYYRIENAGLTPDFKKRYFEILKELQNTKNFEIEKTISDLYRIKNRKNQFSVQFSFTTKLLNTINENLPIYDSEVAKVFSFSQPYSRPYNQKIEIYLNQYSQINDAYKRIIEENLLYNVVKKFDSKFTNNNIGAIKKLDFIFWSTGKIKNTIGDDGFLSIKELDFIDELSNKQIN
ncbi:hypothetical protein E0W68_06215 [Flavobacterium salilacus subsp. salilacus]|uniref:hypothetical protein n=1 Tax=Flavobacterium TaxID=237 RepID=UPI001074A52F|nr:MULTISPECIES: hypothetical protein [Flavobacterium]KAF2518847.1 hypothetical protein E0W68_06215 [Flavobacterium salilacus subsp. salilacus]MBE1614994.1 hypothetical protein [Flavobacterium sp. SaA2.13]